MFFQKIKPANEKKAVPERDGSETEESKFIRSILGNTASKKDVSDASDESRKQQLIQNIIASEPVPTEDWSRP